MASYQVGDACYSTPLAAVQAMAAREVGRVTQIGTATYVTDVTATTATSITYKLTNVSSTASVSKVFTVTPLPCGLLDTSDGLMMAWGIATAWLITAAVVFIRKGIHE